MTMRGHGCTSRVWAVAGIEPGQGELVELAKKRSGFAGWGATQPFLAPADLIVKNEPGA